MNRLDWLESQVMFLTRRIFDAEQVIMRLEGVETGDDRSLGERLEESKRIFGEQLATKESSDQEVREE